MKQISHSSPGVVVNKLTRISRWADDQQLSKTFSGSNTGHAFPCFKFFQKSHRMEGYVEAYSAIRGRDAAQQSEKYGCWSLTWGSNSPILLFTSYSTYGKYKSLLCDMFVHPSNTENQVV